MKKNRNISSITAADRKKIDGLVKHMGKSGAAVFGGQKHKVSELVAMLEARIAKATLVETTRTAWRKAVAEKDAMMEGTDEVVLALEHFLLVTYGATADILEDFGLAPTPKKTSTVKAKYAAVTKAEATRARRRKATDGTPPTPIVPAHVTNGTPS